MVFYTTATDRDEGFLEVKQAETNELHKSIIGALKAAASKWEFEQINFVVGNRGSVVESDFYTKLIHPASLSYALQGEWDYEVGQEIIFDLLFKN